MMTEPKNTKPAPEPAETLSEEDLEKVAGGLALPADAHLNIQRALSTDQRAVLSTVTTVPDVEVKLNKI